jgi:formylglycine-generating enzyme required for sulfatase activity
MAFVWIGGGCFQMGSPVEESGRDSDEGPAHEVCVDGFWLAKYEVTNSQYRKFRPGHDSRDFDSSSLNGGSQPAVHVSWEDAQQYAQWLTRRSGGRHRFRLPTEAEWEYACRSGTHTARYWGESPDNACGFANVADATSKKAHKFPWAHHHCDDGYAVTAPVGSFMPNAYGLHDMLGNAWEWVADYYDEKAYRGHQRNDPLVDVDGSLRVWRGGGWSSIPADARCAGRDGFMPAYADSFLGFRLVRSP